MGVERAEDLERYRELLDNFAVQFGIGQDLKSKLSGRDFVGETLLYALTKLHQLLDMSEKHVLNWLHRVLVNKMIDAIRRERRHGVEESLDAPIRAESNDFPERLADLVEAVQPGASTRAGLQEQIARLNEEISDLPPRQQLILKMRWFDELTGAEIADSLGMTTDAVRGLLGRAMMTLRERMQCKRV